MENKQTYLENKDVQAAARLMQIPMENLMDYPQDVLSSVEAIAVMYDITHEQDETIVQDALQELEQLLCTEILRQSMQEVAQVIGFDFDAETLCHLDEQTQNKLMFQYLYDSDNVVELYEIARFGVLQQELVPIANLIGISTETLYALPEQMQENLYGTYQYHRTEETEAELIARLRNVAGLSKGEA